MRSTVQMVRQVAVLAAIFLCFGTSAFAQGDGTLAAARVHISVAERRLWVVEGPDDTVFTAPIAVGSGRTLSRDQQTWEFITPLGVTRIVAKDSAPLWVPPDWAYIEVAQSHDLRVERLARNARVSLSGGRTLVVRGDSIGVVGPDGVFELLIEDEHVVFDGTLFIPPFGTTHRKVPGVLGQYRLKLANGVALHGTPLKDSIGFAVTHGCVRLHDADIEWLYTRLKVGTEVVIH